MNANWAPPTPPDSLHRLQRRAERERTARLEAERLLESKSLELFSLNQQLVRLNAHLERRVEERTAELETARAAAVTTLETDYLTEVASRSRFSSYLEEALARVHAGGSVSGLVLLDIDNFKMINDTFGHGYGDQLLVVIASRLRRAVGSGGLVARIGGDEFGVILQADDLPAIAKAAKRLLCAFQAPISAGGLTFSCTASAGMAVAPVHTLSSADLQRFADLALYKVKSGGGRGMATFKRSLLKEHDARQRLEADLKEAIARNRCEMWFQPIVNLETGSTEAVEALARWSDGRGKWVAPDVFIPLAEQCGLIRTLGKQLLRKALRSTKPWIESGLIERVTFNVSPVELFDRNFQRAVMRALDEEGFPGECLMLEITEGVVLRSTEVAGQVMRSLQTRGIRFAMDDFGSGYSNISYLQALPFSSLKIDRMLLVDVERDPVAQAIIRNMVTLCHDLGIRAICEGVESKEQLAFLQKIGCDAAQGYLMQKPLPPDQMKRVLERSELLDCNALSTAFASCRPVHQAPPRAIARSA